MGPTLWEGNTKLDFDACSCPAGGSRNRRIAQGQAAENPRSVVGSWWLWKLTDPAHLKQPMGEAAVQKESEVCTWFNSHSGIQLHALALGATLCPRIPFLQKSLTLGPHR